MSDTAPSAPDLTRPTQPRERLQGVDLFFAALFCVLWASGFSVSKTALADAPPLLLIVLRYSLAGLVLLAIAAATGHWQRLTRRDLMQLVLIGLFLHALHLGLSWNGLTRVSSGFAAILFSTSPILIAFLSAPVLGERLTIPKVTGLILGIIGVGIVFRSRLGSGAEDLVGTLLLMGGVAALVIGSVMYKKIAPRGGLWTGASIQFFATALAVLPASLLLEDVSDLHVSQSLILALFYIVFATTIGSFCLWLYLLSRTSASAAASLLFLTPPLGLLLGWLMLGETIAYADLIGIIPIAIGIRLATR